MRPFAELLKDLRLLMIAFVSVITTIAIGVVAEEHGSPVIVVAAIAAVLSPWSCLVARGFVEVGRVGEAGTGA